MTSTLTDRQVQVLRLMAEGCTHVEIGVRLEISSHTAKTHVRRVCKKLGAVDRASAVHQGHIAGYLHAQGPRRVQP